MRPMPATLPEPEYPAHFEARYVSRCGAFKFKQRQIFRRAWDYVSDGRRRARGTRYVIRRHAHSAGPNR